jgi:hypothetical protein
VLLSVMPTPSLRRLIGFTTAFELALVFDSVGSSWTTICLLFLRDKEKMTRFKTHSLRKCDNICSVNCLIYYLFIFF